MPTISVILPNRNHAHVLPHALEALALQSVPAIEVIVIDDASSDNSVEVVEGFRGRLPGLQVVRLESHKGAVEALNKGLSLATGDLIYAAASDDIARSDLFARAVSAFEAYPEIGVFCAEALVVDDEGRHKSLRPAAPPMFRRHFSPAAFRDWLKFTDNLCVGVASVARREMLLEEGGYDAKLGPFCDSFLVRKVCLKHGVVFHPEVLGEWHRSTEGISRSIARAPDLTRAYVNEVRSRIEADTSGIFPPGYGQLFERRAMFNAARMALPDLPLAAQLAGAPQSYLWRLAALPLIGRIVAMPALVATFRPMSLSRLLLGRFAQKLRTLFDPSRMKASRMTS